MVMVCKCDRQKNSLVQEHAKEVTGRWEIVHSGQEMDGQKFFVTSDYF
jgi:hypothetical protein